MGGPGTQVHRLFAHNIFSQEWYDISSSDFESDHWIPEKELIKILQNTQYDKCFVGFLVLNGFWLRTTSNVIHENMAEQQLY